MKINNLDKVYQCEKFRDIVNLSHLLKTIYELKLRDKNLYEKFLKNHKNNILCHPINKISYAFTFDRASYLGSFEHLEEILIWEDRNSFNPLKFEAFQIEIENLFTINTKQNAGTL